ncbi:hypothetical protein ACHQM5_027081 [Ranunculus cassubicifolius]
MASSSKLFLLFAVLFATLLISHHVMADEKNDLVDEDELFRGINAHRTSLKLTALLVNDKAECFADDLAEQFTLKNRPCTNATAPGPLPTFADYPAIVNKCALSPADTKDGVIMPVCSQNPTPTQVLTSFTQSPYSKYLNDTKYNSAGIGSEVDWVIVVALGSNTGKAIVGTAVPADSSTGDSVTTTASAPADSTDASFAPAPAPSSGAKVGLNYYLVSMFMGFFLVFLN